MLIKTEARQNMESKGEKEEALPVKYSFRRVYGIGKDREVSIRPGKRDYCYTGFRHAGAKAS